MVVAENIGSMEEIVFVTIGCHLSAVSVVEGELTVFLTFEVGTFPFARAVVVPFAPFPNFIAFDPLT